MSRDMCLLRYVFQPTLVYYTSSISMQYKLQSEATIASDSHIVFMFQKFSMIMDYRIVSDGAIFDPIVF